MEEDPTGNANDNPAEDDAEQHNDPRVPNSDSLENDLDPGVERRSSDDNTFQQIARISAELDAIDTALGNQIEAYIPAKENEHVLNEIARTQEYYRSPRKQAAVALRPLASEGLPYDQPYVSPYKGPAFVESNFPQHLKSRPSPYAMSAALQRPELSEQPTLYGQPTVYEPSYQTEIETFARRDIDYVPEPESARQPPIPGKVFFAKPASKREVVQYPGYGSKPLASNPPLPYVSPYKFAPPPTNDHYRTTLRCA